MKSTQEPDEAGLARLQRFLSGEGRGRTLSFRQLHGFLFAVACAPVEVRFDQIVQQAFYDVREGPLLRRAQSDDVLRPLFALYRETGWRVDALVIDLPAVCAFRPRPLDNLEPGAPVSEWVTGFGYGHLWLRRSWDDRLTPEEDLAMGGAMGVFLFFGSKETAEGLRRDAGGTRRPSLAAMARKKMERFRFSMLRYATLGAVARGAKPAARNSGGRFT